MTAVAVTVSTLEVVLSHTRGKAGGGSGLIG